MYLNIKVSQVVFMWYSVDARNTDVFQSVVDQYVTRRGHLRLGHQPLRLLDDSLGKSHCAWYVTSQYGKDGTVCLERLMCSITLDCAHVNGLSDISGLSYLDRSNPIPKREMDEVV